MATVTDWMKAAEEEAKKYSDAIKANNQYLVDQLNQSKQNTMDQLQQQQDNAIYNLNTNKATINQNATDNAKQLNVAKLLALKDNQSAMNRAGLGTQGVVGSQVNAINNDYGTNLTNVLNQQTSDLRNLEKEKNNTLLAYNTNRLNLENEYGNNLANLQQSINDKALNQYNNVYNNYLAYKQQEYENEQAELARQEAIRQYNEQMAYQREQDAIANAQRWAQINAQKNSLAFSDNENTTDNKTDSEKRYEQLSTAIQKCKTDPGYLDESTISQGILNSLDAGVLTEAQATKLYNEMEQVFKKQPTTTNTQTMTKNSAVSPTIHFTPTLNTTTYNSNPLINPNLQNFVNTSKNSKLPMNYNFVNTTKIK